MRFAPLDANCWRSRLGMPPSLPRSGYIQSACSISRCGAIAAGVRAPFKQTLLTIYPDGMGMPHVVVPISHHLYRLAAALELAYNFIRYAPFERHVARA